MESIYGVPLSINGKRIGGVVGSTARLHVQDRHWFRAGNGYSVDGEIAKVLEEKGIETLEFFNTKTRRVHRIGLAVFLANGWLTKDYGYGRKFVCDSRHYQQAPTAQPQSSAPPSQPRDMGGLGQVGA